MLFSMETSRHTPPSLATCLDRIRAWAKANHWRPARLAREADVAEKVTRGMGSADWSPSASSIKKLEAIIPPEWSEGDEIERANVIDAERAAA